jgi:tRNA modification GTPase
MLRKYNESQHFDKQPQAESLYDAQKSLTDVINGISGGISGALLAMDIRQALNYIGEITGEITTEDLLGNIFSKLCIGQ